MTLIDPDITRARTLPAEVYRSPEVFQAQRERVFPRSWHYLTCCNDLEADTVHPLTFYEGSIEEPLLAVRDGDGVHVFSNVCTHRGHLLIEKPCRGDVLRCRYHGRRFDVRGRMLAAPELEGLEDFPSESDHLAAPSTGALGPLRFAALQPTIEFERVIAPVLERVGFLPLDRFMLDRSTCRTYEIDANWALYCDNYLESFHVPYVHPELAKVLDYASLRTETFEQVNLQIALASGDEEPTFDLPPGHPDHGQRVAAYYFWLFPTTMLNFYPWGLSLNVVEPHGPTHTRVHFVPFVLDATKRTAGPGAALNTVELEDEEVVHSVQRGVASRLYRQGRYSPRREACVHHFHRLLAQHLEL